MGILKKVLPPENRSIYAISKESGISRQIAEDFQKEYPEIPLQYIWHPDEGFQRTAITNRAVFSARAEYLIITDGDCLPAPDFVKVHWSARKQNTFCNGRRLLLSWEYSKSLVSEDILSGKFMTFPVAESEKEILRRHLKSYFYLLIRRKSRLRLMAANLSLFREDMLRVNGFDERFKGWGATDEDLCRRLFRMGMKWKSLYTRARVWHIAHPPVPSKPSKVKLGTNIPYYERGFFLTRPIYGVRKREIADLNVLVEIDGTFSGNENIADIFQSLFPKSRIIFKRKNVS